MKNKTFLSFPMFRQSDRFPRLNHRMRKTLFNIDKHIPNCLFYIDEQERLHFKTNYFNNHTKHENFETKTIIKDDENLINLLNKISIHNNCLSSFYLEDEDISFVSIYRFTFEKTQRNLEYLYHTTDVGPEIILKYGIKPNYSLGVKAHPPLIFLGTEQCWYGRYVYKIKTDQDIFIDTNLDWKRMDMKPYLCVKNIIRPEEIISFKNILD